MQSPRRTASFISGRREFSPVRKSEKSRFEPTAKQKKVASSLKKMKMTIRETVRSSINPILGGHNTHDIFKDKRGSNFSYSTLQANRRVRD
jgi:hypothetical protein